MKSIKRIPVLCFQGLALICLLILFPEPLKATGDLQSHTTITELARTFILSHIDETEDAESVVDITPLDKRVRLIKCDSNLQAFWPYEPRSFQNLSIGIKCTGSQPWKIYLQAKTSDMRKVAVLTVNVTAGQKLENDMISMRTIDILKLSSGSLADYSHLLGRTFKRNVRAGTPLGNQLLTIPMMVEKNRFVQIESGEGAIAVHAEGQALDDGYQGERIRVKNSRSGKIVQATVIDRNTVKIGH